MRTERRSSPDAPEPALPPKRRLPGEDSAGEPTEEEGTQERSNRGESVFGGQMDSAACEEKDKALVWPLYLGWAVQLAMA